MSTTPAPESRPALRVGLMVDTYLLPAWVHRLIERINESPDTQVTLVVVNIVREPPEPSSIWSRLSSYWKSRHYLLYALFQRLDQRRSVDGPDAFEHKDAGPLLEGIPTLEVEPNRTKFSDYFSPQDVQSVRDHNLDVLVRLGFRILRGDILDAARCGIWSYHHGDNRVNRGGPAGFWEVMLGWHCTGAVLQVLTEDLDGGLVLARTWTSTNRVSVRANRNQLYWQALSMLPRKLEELHKLGRTAFFDKHRALQDVPGFYSQRLFAKPKNRELAGPFVRVHRILLQRKVAEWTGWQQWEIRYQLRNTLGSSLWRMKPIVPPGDRFWADPHVVQRNGVYYVFLEELIYAEGRGRIVVLTIDEEGNVSDPRTVLERPYHLSYPFLFEWDGELFMIPETSEQETIECYRCVQFPDQWAYERTLMDGITAADATLLEHGGRWWMFASVRENRAGPLGNELFIFGADSPLDGRWRPHGENPVVSDVRRGRPAGSFIRHQGEILRPAQDCSRGYGWALRLHRIVELTPDAYSEEEVAMLTPDFSPEVRGVHSIARAGNLTVIDSRSRRRGRRQ